MNYTLPCIIFCFWLTGFLFLWKIPTPRKPSRRIEPSSKISVIIPARNEAENLKRCLHSMTSQTMRPDEVIVVNDQSEDETVTIAHAAGCRIINTDTLPEGWLGKPWACWTGANAARGEILMFLDADTRLAPEGIERIVTTFENKRGLLSIQPYHNMKTPHERLSAIFNMIVMAGMNSFTPLGSRLKPAGAFGPCNVCSKKDYLITGGHKNARGDVLESLALGRRFLAYELPVHCYGGRGSVSFRMYPHGLSEMIEGHSKGFGSGAVAISPVLLVMLIGWVFGGVSLTRHFIESMVMNAPAVHLVLWGVLDVLYIVQTYWILQRIGNFGLPTALFFQIPLIFFILVFAYSLLKIFGWGRVSWKGRTVDTTKRH